MSIQTKDPRGYHNCPSNGCGGPQKKSPALSELEFRVFRRLAQLERTRKIKGQRILLNIQVSGGQDSMCLLYALAAILRSHVCAFQNEYILCAQHFNHKQRGEEADTDALFVAQEALKKGVPLVIERWPAKAATKNSQNNFRVWRQERARCLSQELCLSYECNSYWVLTAHHARDHVESVLLHLIRGCGLDGLRGLVACDPKNQLLRLFVKESYQEIVSYSVEKQVPFREDSSNTKDKYTRNYLRHHIIPHIAHINPAYENAFLNLSENISLTPVQVLCESKKSFTIKPDISKEEFLFCVKKLYHFKNLSKNFLGNLFHECGLLQKSPHGTLKEILLKQNGTFTLTKAEGAGVFLEFKADVLVKGQA